MKIQPFQDPFNQQLKPGWSWVREEPAGWRVDDKGLQIKAAKGTLWKTANNAHNVLLRALSESPVDYVLEVTVTSAPAAGGEQAGLISYLDDDNYVKLVRESLEGHTWVVFGREIEAKGEMINRLQVDGESVRIRLQITRSGAAGFVQGADGQWKEIGHCDASAKPATRVGLVAHGAPADADRWARFNDFSIAQP